MWRIAPINQVGGTPAVRNSYRAVFLCLLALLALLAGCAGLPITGRGAERLTVTAMARLDADALFAVDPGGHQLAFAHDGLWSKPLSGGEARLLAAERPLALAWSPDGRRLAATLPAGSDAQRIVVFEGERVVAETAGSGSIAALFWSADDRLLAVELELEAHSFGTSCREVLLSWGLAGAPQRTVLHEVTLKPVTVRRWGQVALLRAIDPQLSPAGDELLYGRIQDPPAFEAYLKRMIRNLDSGAEREIGASGFVDSTARFSVNGEGLLLQTANRTALLDPWSGAEMLNRSPTERLVLPSAAGRCLLADGRFVDAAGRVLLFPARTITALLQDGRLLAAHAGRLFLVGGLAPPAGSPLLTLAQQQRLRTLRAWRAAGLITAGEYRSAREKELE